MNIRSQHPQAWWSEDEDLAFRPWASGLAAGAAGAVEAGFVPDKTIVGTPGDDTLHGGRGDDTIDGAQGADEMSGRRGDDTYFVDNVGDVVIELDGQGTDTVMSGVDYTLPAFVENLDLLDTNYPFNLVGIGNELDNVISGSAGNNRLEGLGGDDYIDSGGLIGPSGADTLIGGDGNDTLVGGSVSMGSDELYGGAGNDVLQVTRGANSLYGEDGNDSLVAGEGGPYGAADYLSGGAGRDTLNGGGGLDGGDDNDLMYTSFATSSANGGLGNDTIEGPGGSGYVNFYVDGGGGRDSIDVYATNNRLFLSGGAGNDTLRGGAGQEVSIDGGGGADLITGYKTYPGGPLTVTGGGGNDTIEGSGAGDISLYGNAGADSLHGTGTSGFSLLLDGGADDDILSAFGSDAHLLGGAGSDTFVLTGQEVPDQDMLWVDDFASGVDRLAVSQSSLMVGNGDLVVNGAVTVAGPGGFKASAELVIVTTDLAGGALLDQAAAAIGHANQAYAPGQTAVFMVDDGSSSYALYFESSGNDATVSADELSVIGRLSGAPSTGVGDIVWSA
jgi:Ca2+-binding RTX toxin-like protein